MGSTSFFSKLASVDPLAQALDLPGAHKYQDTIGVQVGPQQGPYSGVQATLAGANAGYRAGGPGSNGDPNAPNAPAGGGAGYGLGATGTAQNPGGVPNYRPTTTTPGW